MKTKDTQTSRFRGTNTTAELRERLRALDLEREALQVQISAAEQSGQGGTRSQRRRAATVPSNTRHRFPSTRAQESRSTRPLTPRKDKTGQDLQVGDCVYFTATNTTRSGRGTIRKFSHNNAFAIIVRDEPDNGRIEVQRAPFNLTKISSQK